MPSGSIGAPRGGRGQWGHQRALELLGRLRLSVGVRGGFGAAGSVGSQGQQGYMWHQGAPRECRGCWGHQGV